MSLYFRIIAIVNKNDLVKLSAVRALCRSGAARQIRIAAGLSQAECAAPCEVEPSTILRWERGDRSPHGEPALRYGELLDTLLKPAGRRQ